MRSGLHRPKIRIRTAVRHLSIPGLQLLKVSRLMMFIIKT